VYRILAEAIHNVVKHAAATSVSIRLGVRHHTLTATVSDDGRGLPDPGRVGAAAEDGPAADGSWGHGYGLTAMRERAERWGGTMRIGCHARSGTSVRAVIPLPVHVPEPAAEAPGRAPNPPLVARL